MKQMVNFVGQEVKGQVQTMPELDSEAWRRHQSSLHLVGFLLD